MMADSYEIKFNASVTPIEKQQLADGSDYAHKVHSSIDAQYSGSIQRAFGSTSSFVRHVASYELDGATVTLQTAMGVLDTIEALFIVVLSTDGNDNGYSIRLDGTSDDATLKEVGDMFMVTRVGDGQNGISNADIDFYRNDGNDKITIAILAGCS